MDIKHKYIFMIKQLHIYTKPSFLQMDKLKVTLPKFSIRGSLELNEPLAALNISKLFGAGLGHEISKIKVCRCIYWFLIEILTDFNLLNQSRPGSNLTGFVDLDSTPADQVTDKHKLSKTCGCIAVDSLGYGWWHWLITLKPGGPGALGVRPTQGFHRGE